MKKSFITGCTRSAEVVRKKKERIALEMHSVINHGIHLNFSTA
jgi:hypothetical protein